MAWQTLTFQLTSSAPLLLHNGQMANPLNKWAKAMKQISAKKAKTDADYEELARLEFMAGLYLSPEGPVIPSFVVDALLVAAAKKVREGNEAKAGVFCPENALLQYDGPRTPDELWKDEGFRHIALVRVSTARVARCRPVFNNWTAVVKVSVETGVVNPARIDDWMAIAGTQIGVGDWRPKFGRFQAQRP